MIKLCLIEIKSTKSLQRCKMQVLRKVNGLHRASFTWFLYWNKWQYGHYSNRRTNINLSSNSQGIDTRKIWIYREFYFQPSTWVNWRKATWSHLHVKIRWIHGNYKTAEIFAPRMIFSLDKDDPWPNGTLQILNTSNRDSQ